jgi:hypothetical protein
MRVICIENKDYENFLIIGKIYDVEQWYYDNRNEFEMIDNGSMYPVELFKLLSEIRNEKIDKLLGYESSMYR